MRPGYSVTLAASFFLVIVGWLRRTPQKQQRQIVGLALINTALIAASEFLSKRFPASAQAVGDWLPCLLVLIVYWQAGRFMGTTPNVKLQDRLAEFDRRRLGKLLDHWAGKWSTTWFGTYFELAYLFCYVLIPLGVGALYWANLRSAIDVYWATVLSGSYFCYLLVPFAQTLPPRLLPGSNLPPGSERHEDQKIRSLNLFILRHASIHLNTFPSAHVASTIGASLVLLHFVPAVGVVFLLISMSIAAGAVVGRYHYALDVILGAMLSIGVAACCGRP